MNVHRYWSGPPRPLHRWTLGTVRAAAPDGVEEWSDDNLPAECLTVADAAAGLVQPQDALRHRANVVRWWLLYQYGGWWADHDLILLRPLVELPFPVTAAHGETRCNCFMGFPDGHGLPGEALDIIANTPAGGRSPDVSGELLLTRLADGYDVAVLPLPFDVYGQRTSADLWGIHLYESARREAT